VFWYLVETDATKSHTVVQPFRSTEKANAAYTAREKELWEAGREAWLSDYSHRVCLFRADSLRTLRTTHGNWFYPDTEVLRPIR
jgi:hypothetical protein